MKIQCSDWRGGAGTKERVLCHSKLLYLTLVLMRVCKQQDERKIVQLLGKPHFLGFGEWLLAYFSLYCFFEAGSC
jgi:hypothetical protein